MRSYLVSPFLSALIVCALSLASENIVVAANSAGAETESVSPDVNRPIKDKWALIVGISDFQDSKLNLKYAAKDATDFANFLVKEGNFAADHVQVLTDTKATRTNILSLLGDRWLPHVANPDDLVVLYFSSHGSPSDIDVSGVNYILAWDSQPDNLFASGIPMQELIHIVKSRVHTDRLVLILDACHSGAAEPGSKGLVRTSNVDADAIAQGTGQLVITSSEPNQRSWESATTANGIFTKNLIAAFRRQGENTTLGSAFDYVKEHVQEEVLRERGVLQTPVLKSKWQGRDLLLASHPTAPRPSLSVSLPEIATRPHIPQAASSMLPPAVPTATHTLQAANLPAPDNQVPRTWNSLEKNAWGTLLGTWIYDPTRGEFDATYNTGSSAVIKLDEFGETNVSLTGRFRGRSFSAPKGQRYTFRGVRQGNRIHGTVTYDHLGIKVKGTWEAWW